MNSTTGMRTPTAPTTTGGENQQKAQRQHLIEAILWSIGFIVLIVASVMVHFHPGPWPFDLQTTIAMQHLPLWSWVQTSLTFVNALNDPLPGFIALAVWFIGLSLFRLFPQAIFITFGTSLAEKEERFL